MVKACNFYYNQINGKINLLLPICTDLPFTQRDFFPPKLSVHRTIEPSFCIPFSPHPPTSVTTMGKTKGKIFHAVQQHCQTGHGAHSQEKYRKTD